ncbi:copper radical oxidase [Macrolepiota fuliginosa MF-IS2]|uniref:Copper radical oxidase n=1 Tax=Macrolepiota fuliginosa MF-IS2 TaxID=1400762 RepID=A0A9P6C112_9AGAR|nr:copper radical oxidase [Macrolepiota fuliginosa MF-IS2]
MRTLLPPLATLYLSTTLAGLVRAQNVLPPPGQPAQQGNINNFEIIGDSLVSAQQLFVGTEDKVFIVDKVENNPARINGHPAWASEWALGSNKQRTMDALTNTFCAGGNVLGNGTWLNVGGNQAVTYGGNPAPSQDGGGPYDNPDGRQSIRLLTPCDDGKCDWILSPHQSDQRWYPTLETLEDGSIIILGGCKWGGYVNWPPEQDTPTYEFFPSRGAPVQSNILATTLPANLYPLTWLLPSGLLLVQSNWNTALLNYTTGEETPLDDMPDAVRVYPASAGTVMLPLTAANNWTATILFCGGSNVRPKQWLASNFIVPTYGASTSCVTLTPDVSGSYVQDDPLPIARSMVNFLFLPDGRIFALNGASLGTAGYGNDSWAIGQSYADNPVLTPAIYDLSKPAGQRWSSDGLQASVVPRMYHSSATLLPDGSILISGSNPNADYTTDVKYPTEYRTEIFYPSYYNERRPQPKGLLSQLSYGGPVFDIQLDSDDLFGNVQNVKNASVIIIRTGFSTHAMNMGQRYLQLESTYTGYSNNTATLHVRQMPPNPAIVVPGPAFIFVVVNGVPSVGLQVMIGSGEIGKQQTLPPGDLPESLIMQAPGGAAANANAALGPGSGSSMVWKWTLCVCSSILGGFLAGW